VISLQFGSSKIGMGWADEAIFGMARIYEVGIF